MFVFACALAFVRAYVRACACVCVCVCVRSDPNTLADMFAYLLDQATPNSRIFSQNWHEIECSQHLAACSHSIRYEVPVHVLTSTLLFAKQTNVPQTAKLS